jgi:hypothetical protein
MAMHIPPICLWVHEVLLKIVSRSISSQRIVLCVLLLSTGLQSAFSTEKLLKALKPFNALVYGCIRHG